jgi:hypothetical protein
VAYSFNGLTKRITITNVSSVDVKDLYSSWKQWALLEDNLRFLPALRTIGGDPTVEGQSAPAYYFLTNGWRVIIDGIDVAFSFNLYTDEGENPVITLNGATALINNSDIGIVETLVDQAISFQGYVHVDTSGESGTDYPIGTPTRPVNNLGDASKIAAKYKIDNILLHVVTEDPYDMTGVESSHKYYGKSRDVEIDATNGPYEGLHRAVFNNLTICGDLKGAEVEANTCHIADVQNCFGYFKDCGLEGNIHVGLNEYIFLIDCYSNIPGNSSPVLDLNPNGPAKASVRRYSGGLLVQNLQHPEDLATVEFVSGKCILDDTNTQGVISIRGMVKVVDNSSGAVIDTSAAIGNLIDTSNLSIDSAEVTVDLTSVESKLEVINRGVQKASKAIPHGEDLT